MRKRIKVALVIPSLGIGGAEKMVIDLIGNFNSELFEVMLFVRGKKLENQFAKFIDDHRLACVYLNLSNKFSAKSFFRFHRALKEFNPDIVNSHLDLTYTFIWCILNRKKLLVTVHSQPYRIIRKRLIGFTRVLQIFNNIHFVGVSKLISEEIIQVFRVNPDIVSTIYNPINISKYQEENISCTNEFSFVHIGRFNPVKNHDLLLKCFARVHEQIPNIKLYLAGTGELFDNMQSLAKKLNIHGNVTFLGNVQDIPELLRKSNCFIMTSITEALPISILEAMAAGLPIISTNVGGINELVQSNGILVESKNYEELCNAMITMISNREMREKMAEKSRELSFKYRIEKIIKDYEKLYLKL